MKKRTVRFVLASALAIGLTLPLALTASAQPDYASDCHKRLEADRAKIDKEAAKHGPNSPQVARAVDRMDADRQWCRDHHADWDHDRFDIGIYIRH